MFSQDHKQLGFKYLWHNKIKKCQTRTICLSFKIVIMIHIACISRGNNDWHDGIFGTIFCSSTSHISVNLDLSGISLPNSLLFNVLSIALCTKSLIVTTCYFPAEAYSWVFIVSWRISFQFLQKVSNNEIICLCRIKKVIITTFGLRVII